jgi:hypothetical protein
VEEDVKRIALAIIALAGFGSSYIAFPTSAHANVCRWQVDGQWTAIQRRDGNTVRIGMDLKQTGDNFTGRAFTNSIGWGGVNGTLREKFFDGLIRWSDGRRGSYRAHVDTQWNGNQQSFVLVGTSFGVEAPHVLYQWWNTRPMYYRCFPN